MLLIISSHFSVHGRFNFPANSISINKLWTQFMVTGHYGNNLFVLISGYFLVKSQGFKVRKLFNLWLRIIFYSILLFLTFIFLGIEKFSWKTAVRFVMPLTLNQWWFATAYFILYLMHPYLNILLNNLSRRDYEKFLILIFTCCSIIPALTSRGFGSYVVTDFVCLYSLAGYFRLHDPEFGNKKFILYGIGFLLVNCLLIIFINVILLKFPSIGWKPLYFVGMLRPFTVLGTLCLFLGFRKLNIKNNNFINLRAAATFGVYLIHEHLFVKNFLWRTVFKNASWQDSRYLIPYSIAAVIIVYVVCTVIEIVRSKIFKLISNGKLL